MRLNQWLVNQLGRPSALTGWLLAGIWNRRNRALNDTALAALDLAPDDRVLEIGFGGGYLLDKVNNALPRGFAAGIDAAPALARLARRRFKAPIQAGKMEIQCAPAEAIPFPDERFTRAVSVNSIFFWQDVPGALSELNRVLEENPGKAGSHPEIHRGYVYFGFPQVPDPRWAHQPLAGTGGFAAANPPHHCRG